MTSDDRFLRELDRAINKFLATSQEDYEHWLLIGADEPDEGMFDPLELQRSVRRTRDAKRLRVLTLLESKSDVARYLLLDLLHRWRQDEVTERDLPGLLMLKALGLVRTASLELHNELVFGYLDQESHKPDNTTAFLRYSGFLMILVWKPGTAPTLSDFSTKQRESEVFSYFHDDVRITETAKAAHPDWIAAFQSTVDQVGFLTVAQHESLINREAIESFDADAREFRDTFDIEGGSLTPAELSRGIDLATADMDWALNLLGPPPAPTGKSPGAPTPVKPLGSTS